MTLLSAALIGALVAAATAAAVSGIIAWSGPVDRPRDRSPHVRPTPTAGGLGLIAGGSVGTWVVALLAPTALAGWDKIAAALALASVLGVFGALDDLFDFDARLKFLIQSLLALGFSFWVANIQALPLATTLALPLGPLVGVLGTSLWIVVVVNAVNFMDGANGLAPGVAALVLVAFALAAFASGADALGAAALSAAAAGAGFLPWNVPKGRLFQGDAGALFSSFMIAALAVIGAGSAGRGPVFVFFAPLALLPFLTDVLLTLLARVRSKKPLLEAHSEHLYQRWLSHQKASHTALTVRVCGLTALFALGGLALRSAGPNWQASGFAAGALIAVIGWIALSRRTKAPKAL